MTSSGDIDKLRFRYLPCCNSDEEIALAMGMSVGKLRFLTLQHPVSIDTHYTHFSRLKSNGESRIISAPIPSLKAAQAWILHRILERVEIHNAAHGFRRNRSIVTNARSHVGKEIVIKIDLQDFFGSIDYPRVRSVFFDLGYSEPAVDIFSLLCTARSVKQVGVDR
jgi:RNA-directed DNA polymerase